MPTTTNAMTNYLESRALSHFLRNTASTQPATVYLALFSIAPTDAGGGTELTATGYARQAATFGAPSGTSPTVTANTNLITFGGAGNTAGFPAVVACAIFDALTVGNMFFWGTTTSTTAGIGESITVAIGALTVSLN